MQRSYLDLPEELIVNILSRLPVKSVGLCQCVSKPWRALLSGHSFIRDHLRNLGKESLSVIFISSFLDSLWSARLCTNNAHQLIHEITISAKKLSFPNHPHCWNHVYASCDGLLLVEDTEGKMFVLNPLTGAIRQVSRPPFSLSDPLGRHILYAFGYDSVNHDYKIVTLSFYCDTQPEEDDYTETFVDIYSLKTGTWGMPEGSLNWCGDGPLIPGLFVNGSIHWQTDYKPTIMAFDLSQEKFHELPPCSYVGNVVTYDMLVVLGEHLCTFNHGETDIWMMKEYGVEKSWTKIKMDVYDLDPANIWPSCMLGQEEMVLVKNCHKLVMCNLKQGTLKDVLVRGIPGPIYPQASFVESPCLTSCL